MSDAELVTHLIAEESLCVDRYQCDDDDPGTLVITGEGFSLLVSLGSGTVDVCEVSRFKPIATVLGCVDGVSVQLFDEFGALVSQTEIARTDMLVGREPIEATGE
jgi:hypothetical protein